MATDHDFKIKNGAQIENGFLLIGKEALSSSEGYMGMKTSNMTGTSDYMIISGTGDNNTYLSAKAGASVIVRGGGNASAHQLVISSAGASFAGNLTVEGNFTVNGTTTTLNTATLNVEDKNIILNYGSGDTSASANGAGITIQDAVAQNHNATILWNTSGDRFDFSDPIELGAVGDNYTPSSNKLGVTGYGIIGNRSAAVYITNSNSSGTVQIGVGGAHNANPKLTVSSSAATFTVPISSGAITSSGQITAKNAVLTDDGSGSPLLKISADDNAPWAIQLYREDLSGGPQVFASNTTTWSFQGHIDLRPTYAYKVDGTTVIDSSRNISAVDVTATGNVSLTGALLVNGNTAVDKSGTNYMVFYDGSGAPALYAGNTTDNRNYYQSNHHRFRSDDASTNFAEISSVGMIIGAAGPETNMGKLHIKDSDSGATPYQNGNGGITIERNGRAALNFLTPANQDAYVFWGDPDDANVAYIGYSHSNNQAVWKTGGTFRLQGGRVDIDEALKIKHSSTVLDITGDASTNTYFASTGEIRVRPNGTTINKIVLNSSYINAPAYRVGGTTVIDSSRNLTNIGTISASGAITSTSGSSSFLQAIVNNGGLRVAGGGTYSDHGNQMYLHTDSSGFGRLAVHDLRIMTGANNSRTEALRINSSGNSTFAGSVTGTYFLASGGDSTPAGTTFSNVFKGSNQRTVYFDSGDGSAISTWYGSGNTPFAAIDANNGVLRLYVNNTSGNWNERIQMNSSGITNYGTTTVVATNVHLDSTGSAYYRADGGTNSWKYLNLATNGTTNWDIATKNNDLSGALQFRPSGGPTNRTYMQTSGNWVFNGRLTNTDTAEGQKVVLNFDTGGDMILGHDGSYGTTGNGRYITLGFGGTTNGTNRIFAHNGTADGIYFAAATGQGFRWRPNGSGVNEMELSSSGLLTLGGGEVRIGQDSSYGNYATIGFGGTGNGANRVFAHKSGGDGLFLASATGRHIYFRTNGSTNETFRMSATGDFQMGSANTTVIDASRNLTNIGTMSNTGKHSSSIGSNATYSRPLLEITSSSTPTQIKITTNILYSGTGASTHAHSVRISGFQYGSAQMADLQIGWHVYNNQFYNRSVTSSGSWAPTVTLAVENNKVVIHLASPGYWPKLYVESMYNAFGGAGQASGWSWADAAISADSGTPNQTVPYKFDYGNGVLNSAGTTVIDSSRNLTNIGTISSGAITSSGAVSASGALSAGAVSSFSGGTSDYAATFSSSDAYSGIRFQDPDGTGVVYYRGATDHLYLNSSTFSVGGSTLATNYEFQVNGDANITGSLSSSAITTTGNLLLDGGRAIFDTDTGSQRFQLNRLGVSSSHNQALRVHVDDSNVVFESQQDETNRYGGYQFNSKHGSTTYTRFQITAGSTSEVLMYNNTGTAKWQWDGNNNRQAINKLTPAYTLDVNGEINANKYRIGGTEVINSSGQFIGGLNPSSLDITHSSADSVLRIAHGAANNLDAVIQLSGSAADMADEGAEIWYDNNVGDVHIATTYPNDDAYIRFHTRTGASKSTSNERLTIAGHGTVGINKSSGLDSSYKLDMGGHIKMNNNHIHYINQAHFNPGTRFTGSSGSTTILRSASSTTSNWLAFQSGSSATTRGYVGGNSDSGHSVGLLDQGGNWAVRHVNDQGTYFYSDGQTEQAAIGSDLVSGDYGGMVLKSAKNGWVGYSLNNRAVFMHDNSNVTGIYNDVDNEWFAQFQRNGSSYIYTNGHATLQTLTPGIQVNSSPGESTSQVRLYTNGTLRGYLYANTSNDIGILDEGGSWAIRHLNDQGTEFRTDGSTLHAAIGKDLVSGSFGSMVVYDTKSGWGGYSINNRVVFMHDNGNTSGLYNDVNNHWLVKTQNGGTTELYFNGSKKLETTTSGAVVTGNIAHDGLTMTSGTDIDQLYTVTDSLTITTSWQNTSINYNDLSTGTYIIQVYVHDHGNGGAHYNEYYSGMMSWYAGTTNSTEFDELALHRAGHAPNDKIIFLRTLRTASNASPNLVLQIRGNYTRTAAANYVFKLRRMI